MGMQCVTLGVHTFTAASIILARQYAINDRHRSTRRRRWSERGSADQIRADRPRRASIAMMRCGPGFPRAGRKPPRGLYCVEATRWAAAGIALCYVVTLAFALSPNTARVAIESATGARNHGPEMARWRPGSRDAFRFRRAPKDSASRDAASIGAPSRLGLSHRAALCRSWGYQRICANAYYASRIDQYQEL
jgi:hypothetical protein